MIWREACGVLSQNERNTVSIGLREQKAFEIQRRLSRIRTLSRTIERADKPKKKRGSDLYAHVCVLNARIEYHARTLILPFSGRAKFFAPKEKKGEKMKIE